MTLREDANKIIQDSIQAAMPDSAVGRALERCSFGSGRLLLTAAGKGGWQMAKAAYDVLGDRIQDGVVITKYDHAKGPIGNLRIFEAGHPVPDENSFRATQAAIDLVKDLTAEDTVLYPCGGTYRSYKTAAGLRRGYCRDEHRPQAPFCRQRGPVCRTLRPCPGLFHRPFGYYRGSFGYDRFRPRLSG